MANIRGKKRKTGVKYKIYIQKTKIKMNENHNKLFDELIKEIKSLTSILKSKRINGDKPIKNTINLLKTR